MMQSNGDRQARQGHPAALVGSGAGHREKREEEAHVRDAPVLRLSGCQATPTSARQPKEDLRPYERQVRFPDPSLPTPPCHGSWVVRGLKLSFLSDKFCIASQTCLHPLTYRRRLGMPSALHMPSSHPTSPPLAQGTAQNCGRRPDRKRGARLLCQLPPILLLLQPLLRPRKAERRPGEEVYRCVLCGRV